MYTKASNPQCKINSGNLTFRILILQTTWFWVFLHDFGSKSRFSFGILILQTIWFTAKSRFSFGILILQASWFTAYLHVLGTKSRFSFGTLILQTTWFTANLHDFGTNPDSVVGSLSSKPPWLPLFTIYLHDLGTKSRFNFWIWILQTTWFTAYLHDLGTKSRFSVRILILQKKGWDKCTQMSTKVLLQKPLIHNAKLILEILLFGSWSSKLPGLECFLHDFGTKSRFSFGILILQTSWFTAYLHDLGLNLDSIRGSWSFKKRMRRMSTKASNPQCKINFGNLTFRILILQTIWFWLFLHDFGTKSRFSFGTLILQTSWFTANLHDFGTKSTFSFGILILQTTWFSANLHDLGTKSNFSFGILILQTSCFTANLHDLGTKSRFSVRILILQKE